LKFKHNIYHDAEAKNILYTFIDVAQIVELCGPKMSFYKKILASKFWLILYYKSLAYE